MLSKVKEVFPGFYNLLTYIFWDQGITMSSLENIFVFP